MIEPPRLLLGILVLVLLTPLMAVATPGLLDRLLGLFKDQEMVTRQNTPDVEPNNSHLLMTADESDHIDKPMMGPNEPFSTSPQTTGSQVLRDPAMIKVPVAPPSTAEATETSGPETTVKPTIQQSTTTPTPAPTTTSERAPAASGPTITGNACPCEIRGVAELVGNVNLRGDLVVVNGGKLIARAGVTVQGNGHQIMFMNGGSADFQGTETFTWSGDGSNANLARDIVIDNVSRVMFMNGAGRSTIRFVRVTNSGRSEQLGFYPLHWHLNGNSTRGTLVEGVVVDNSANHAFVPHGSHGITFRHTIAMNIIREAYWWDPGGPPNVSHDIVYDHALAGSVDYPRSFGDAGLHHRMSAFYLGRGTGHIVRNSVARNTRGGQDCSGFHWPEKDHGVWTFQNNASYGGSCHGIFIWQNDDLPHVVSGFTGNRVSHGAYTNKYRFENLNVDGVIVHAQGWNENSPVYEGGHLGAVVAMRHTLPGAPVIFRNLTVDSFTVNNGQGGIAPGLYVFENTNLGCSDVVYQNVVPGTEVRIEGASCG